MDDEEEIPVEMSVSHSHKHVLLIIHPIAPTHGDI